MRAAIGAKIDITAVAATDIKHHILGADRETDEEFVLRVAIPAAERRII
jgi:hypothetical protein